MHCTGKRVRVRVRLSGTSSTLEHTKTVHLSTLKYTVSTKKHPFRAKPSYIAHYKEYSTRRISVLFRELLPGGVYFLVIG